jgi:hypothetical protein
LIVVGNVLLFGITLPHFFLSDDFAQIEWAAKSSVPEIFGNLSGLYRPVQSILFKSAFTIFGTNPIPFNMLNLLVQIGNSLLVFALARRLTGSMMKGFVAGAIFSVHFMHVEPVIWVSGSNELLAAGFLLGSLILFDYRGIHWRVMSLLLFVIAMFSKESAMVMPLLLVLWIWAKSVGQTERPHHLMPLFKETVPYFCISAIYIAVRFPVIAYVKGNGAYGMKIGVNVLKNATFMISSMFFRLDFRDLLATWNAYGKGPAAVLKVMSSHPFAAGLVAISIAFFAIMFWRADRSGKFGGAWFFCCMFPMVLLIGAGERFTYLPSIGFAIMTAVTVLRLKKVLSIAAACAICVYLFAVGFVDSGRWIRASEISESVVRQLADYIQRNPGIGTIYIQDLPDNYRGAYLFRGGLDSAGRMISGRKDLKVIGVEGQGTLTAEPALYLRYVDGGIEQITPEERKWKIENGK